MLFFIDKKIIKRIVNTVQFIIHKLLNFKIMKKQDAKKETKKVKEAHKSTRAKTRYQIERDERKAKKHKLNIFDFND